MSRSKVQSPFGVMGIIATLIGSLLLTTAVVIAAGNPAATLDQCANGSITSPDNTPCQAGTEWVNGNLGSSKAHYSEGDSVPYRFTFSNLATGSTVHAVTLEWDTTKSSKHALDYITTWNRTVTTANPCAGVSGCTLGSGTTFPIPVDPQVSGGGVTQVAGNFTIFGGATITGVSTYSYANGTGFVGDKSARITVSFTTTVANPVLSWGGHIATRRDWGATNSAISISGSPYHMRLVDLDGSGGNQDRSLSADAVIFPGKITIIKDAVPNDAQDFAFAATGGSLATPFSLDDDADATLSNTKVYSDITSFVTYTIAETTVTGWTVSFSSLTTPCVVTTPNGGSQSASGSTVTIGLKEGEEYSCTFTNTRQQGTITLTKVVQSNNGGNAAVADFPLLLQGVTVTSGASNSRDAGSYTVNETQQSGYEFVSITGTGCPSALGGSITLAAGASVSCTITNRDIAPTLALNKTVSNTNGGTAVEDDFVLTATATGSTITDAGGDVDATAGLSNVEYTLSETGVTGYTAGDWSCSGTGVTWSALTPTKITLAEGAVASCSITNSDSKNDPSGNTTMAWTLQDSATYAIRSGASDAGDATITFKLFDDDACTSQVGSDEAIDVTLNGAGDSASADTATGHDVTPGTYYWMSFYSGDGFNNAAETACGTEVTTISVP